MRIFFLQKVNSLWEQFLAPIRKEFPDVEIVSDPEEAMARIDEADIIVGGKLKREVFEKAENLKLMVVPFTGVNHLPFDLLKQKQVMVGNSHGNAWYVAERTVAMILAFYGKIIEYHNDMREGLWHGFWVGHGLDDTWQSVDGLTASILGTGEIGRYIAEMLRTFRVSSIGYKRNKVDTPPEGFDKVVYDLESAVDQGDMVIVALPSTPETVDLIDEKVLSKMQGKLLVNIGRGGIVEEKALYDALRNNVLQGAAIDCWYNYPPSGNRGFPSNYPIHELDNVVLSPHSAGFTKQAASKGIEQACENIAEFLRNGKPRFLVDLDAGY